MKAKAKANLEASKRLLGLKLVDPAMSRLYYALFQAGIYRMSVLGQAPSFYKAGSINWEHATICGNASVFRQSKRDLALFRQARSLREQADYQTVPVEDTHVMALMPEVERFLSEVCA